MIPKQKVMIPKQKVMCPKQKVSIPKQKVMIPKQQLMIFESTTDDSEAKRDERIRLCIDFIVCFNDVGVFGG